MTFSFYFPLLLDNKTAKTGTPQIQILQERRRRVLRYFAKRHKDFYEQQRSRRAGLIIFPSNISDHYKFQILIIIQLSSIYQFAPCCRFAIFVATLTFTAKCQRFGLVRWAGSIYISRFGIGPWSLHMSRSRFGPDLGPDQIFGTESYRLHNQIWSGPWSDKDLVRTKLVL